MYEFSSYLPVVLSAIVFLSLSLVATVIVILYYAFPESKISTNENSPKLKNKSNSVSRDSASEQTERYLILLRKKKSTQRLQKLKETSFKEPPLYFVPYSSLEWPLNVLSFLHNAVKRELQDLFFMMTVLHKRSVDLNILDFKIMFKWMVLFRQFLFDQFELEEKVLYPWIEGPKRAVMSLSGPLSQSQRIQTKDSIVSSIQALKKEKDKTRSQNMEPVLIEMDKLVHEFSIQLLNYFQVQEKTLAPLIMKKYNKRQEEVIMNKIIQFYRNRTGNHLLLRLLLRPIKDKERMQKIRLKYLNISGVNGFKLLKFKQEFQKSRDVYHKEHTFLVTDFYKRLTHSVLNAEKEDELVKKKYQELFACDNDLEEREV